MSSTEFCFDLSKILQHSLRKLSFYLETPLKSCQNGWGLTFLYDDQFIAQWIWPHQVGPRSPTFQK